MRRLSLRMSSMPGSTCETCEDMCVGVKRRIETLVCRVWLHTLPDLKVAFTRQVPLSALQEELEKLLGSLKAEVWLFQSAGAPWRRLAVTGHTRRNTRKRRAWAALSGRAFSRTPSASRSAPAFSQKTISFCLWPCPPSSLSSSTGTTVTSSGVYPPSSHDSSPLSHLAALDSLLSPPSERAVPLHPAPESLAVPAIAA